MKIPRWYAVVLPAYLAGLLALDTQVALRGQLALGALTFTVLAAALRPLPSLARAQTIGVVLFATVGEVTMVAFIVFYGLDWVATVPPTMALCREHLGGRSAVVFGWIFASHQVGSAAAAYAGGVIRDVTGSYDLAWFGAGALCMLAAVLSISIRRRTPSLAPPPAEEDEVGLPPSSAQAAAVSTHG